MVSNYEVASGTILLRNRLGLSKKKTTESLEFWDSIRNSSQKQELRQVILTGKGYLNQTELPEMLPELFSTDCMLRNHP